MALKQVFITQLTDTPSAAAPVQDTPGDLRYENGKVYKYVKFTGTTAVAAGGIVTYTTNDGVTVDGIAGAVGAGIAVSAVPAGTAVNGWIQCEGIATIATLTSGANGQQVTNTGAANGALKVAAAVTDQVVGVVVDSVNRIIIASFYH